MECFGQREKSRQRQGALGVGEGAWATVDPWAGSPLLTAKSSCYLQLGRPLGKGRGLSGSSLSARHLPGLLQI